MTDTAKKNIEIEYLRVIGMLAVISIHVTEYYTVLGSVNSLRTALVYLDWIFQFAVPLFIFISGFVLYKNYPKGISLGSFYKKRALSILPQYFIFTLFYMLWENYNSIDGITINLKTYTYNLATGGGYYQLWFFALIIQFYVLYPLFLKLYNYLKVKKLHFLMLILALLTQMGWNFIITNYDYFSFSNLTVFLNHVFYFVLGIFACEYYEEVKGYLPKFKASFWALTFFIMNAVFCYFTVKVLKNGIPIEQGDLIYSVTGVSSFVLPILYAILFATLLKAVISIKNSTAASGRIINSLAAYSFGIYLIHPFFIDLIDNALSTFGIYSNNTLFYVIMEPLTILLSYAAVYLISLIPYSKYVIGTEKKRTHNI